MEKRHGLAVVGGTSQATGTTERDKALELLGDYRGESEHRIPSVPKGYVTQFVHDLRARSMPSSSTGKKTTK